MSFVDNCFVNRPTCTTHTISNFAIVFACNILCHFVAQNEDEISCHAHDVVTLLEDLGDGWLRVRKGKDEGYVPQSYVQKN